MGRTALHIAVGSAASLRVVQALVAASPEALCVRDTGALQLPLHVAAGCRLALPGTQGVLEFVLRTTREASLFGSAFAGDCDGSAADGFQGLR